jgi:hypothetical protein
MSIAFEALARIYVDEGGAAAIPRGSARRGAARVLGEREVAALERIDRAGLVLAADSYARKRARPGRS